MFGMGSEAFAGIAMLALIVLGIILSILGLLMPWFVYKIAQRSADLEQHARETNLLLRALLGAETFDPRNPPNEAARRLTRETPR